MAQPLRKTVWRFLKMLKIELPSDPAIALLGIYSKDADVVKRRGTCTPIFIAAMSTIAKLWKEPRRPSTAEWIKKSGVIIYNGILLSHQKIEILPFAMMRMELDCIMLTKISQRMTKPYDFIRMWNLRNKRDEHRERGEKRGSKP